MNAVVYNGKFPFTFTNYKQWDGTYNVEIMDTLPVEDKLRKTLRPKELNARIFSAYVQPIKMSDVWYCRTFTFSFNGECKNDNPIIDIVTLHDDGFNPNTNTGLLTKEEYREYREKIKKTQEENEKQQDELLKERQQRDKEHKEQQEYYKQRDEENKYNTLYGKLDFSFGGNIKRVVDPDKKIFALDCTDHCERLTRLGMELDKILNTTYAMDNKLRGILNVCILGLDDFTVRMLTNKVADSIHINFDLTNEVRDGIPVITCRDYYAGMYRSNFLMILDLKEQINQLQETVAKLTTVHEPSGFKAFLHRLRAKFQ